MARALPLGSTRSRSIRSQNVTAEQRNFLNETFGRGEWKFVQGRNREHTELNLANHAASAQTEHWAEPRHQTIVEPAHPIQVKRAWRVRAALSMKAIVRAFESREYFDHLSKVRSIIWSLG